MLYPLYLILLLILSYSNRSFSQVPKDDFFKGNWVDTVGYKGYVFPTDTFNIMDYGAKNNGVEITTQHIQAALDACTAAGGGVVIVPFGKYLTGSIYIGSYTHLLFADSTRVLASMELEDYPEQLTRVAGIEMIWPQALININDAENVKISGHAIINGRGRVFWNKFDYMRPIYVENDLRWAVDYDCKRPRMLVANNASNLLIKDISLIESPFWTLHVLYSEKVTMDGVTVNNAFEVRAPSTDGINIDSSRDVLVQNCVVSAKDDNFCIKSGRDADGMRVNRPAEYIVIRDNTTLAGAGLIVFGSEVAGGINHIYVKNMKADGTSRGIRFKSARTRGGLIENILMEDIEIKNTPFAFEFTLDWNPQYSYTSLPEGFHYDSIPDHWKTLLLEVPEGKGLTKLRNVTIRNATVTGKSWKAFYVEGFEELPIENFIFENVTVRTETAGEIKNARGWRTINSQFIYDDNNAPKMINSTDMDSFFTPQ
jgi:polygalacturonase